MELIVEVAKGTGFFIGLVVAYLLLGYIVGKGGHSDGY